MYVPAAIISSQDGPLLTRASGLFEVFEETLVHATVLIECCKKDTFLRRHSYFTGTVKIMSEHVDNATKNYIPFAAAPAIPKGNVKRLIYRFNKLASLSAQIADVVRISHTKTSQTICEKSSAIKANCDLIRTSFSLLAERNI